MLVIVVLIAYLIGRNIGIVFEDCLNWIICETIT
uniref:TMhelix containing protein n=1 Tax=Syphacia muris TaxID=451379 RepID=A0A0N5AP51_9BILA